MQSCTKAIKNIKMVEASRTEAIRIVEEDLSAQAGESFKKYPQIQEYLKNLTEKIHFE